jgi:hypothetical protein
MQFAGLGIDTEAGQLLHVSTGEHLLPAGRWKNNKKKEYSDKAMIVSLVSTSYISPSYVKKKATKHYYYYMREDKKYLGDVVCTLYVNIVDIE